LDITKVSDIFSTGWCIKECPSTKTSEITYMPFKKSDGTVQTPPSITGGQYATENIFGYCLPTSVSDLSADQ